VKKDQWLSYISYTQNIVAPTGRQQKRWRLFLMVLLFFIVIPQLTCRTQQTPSAGRVGHNFDTVYAAEGQSQQEFATIQGKIVNVRSGASTDYKVLAQVRQGETYPVLRKQGEWIEITYAPGARGWVAGWLVTLSAYPIGGQISHLLMPSPSPSVQPVAVSQPINGLPTYVRVTANILNVRKGPGLDAAIWTQVHQGTILKVLEKNGDFYGIAFPGNQQAYVAVPYVEETTETEWLKQGLGKVLILNDGTNLREAPSLDAPIIQKAGYGEQYTILEEQGEWYKIALEPSKSAYVAAWVVQAQYVLETYQRTAFADSGLQGKKIVIDPGHGGIDDGATSVSKKVKEKEMNLAVAKKLETMLKAKGATVIMTRTGDTTVSLDNRVRVAIQAQADAFISIHHNTYPSPKMDGTMTFYYHARDIRLAQTVQSALIRTTGLTDRNARYGNLYVLRENKVPAILVELGFISNPQEEQKLLKPALQDKEAAAIAAALEEYFSMRNQ